MLHRIVDKSRPYYAAIVALCSEDLSFLLGSAWLIGTVLWFTGYPALGLTIALGLTTAELTIRRIIAKRPPFRSMTQDQAILALFLLNSLTGLLYSLPAIAMALSPSVAMKIISVIWLIGIMLYALHMWWKAPPFMATIIASPLTVMLVVFAVLPMTEPAASSVFDWVATGSLLALLIFVSIKAVIGYFAFQQNLAAAEAEVRDRLAYLEEQQRTDPLTNVLNRPAFDMALTDMLDERRVNTHEITVFLADLDSFKPINDTYSHQAGDRVLTQTAERLQTLIGERGIVGRLGGDEFIIAVRGLAGSSAACALAEKLASAISEPIVWEGKVLKTAASIGIAMTGPSRNAPPATVSALCSAADQAMFGAKSSGTRQPQFYHADQFTPRLTSAEKQELTESIIQQRIKPYYQPKVHLATGKIIGFEALARWEHKDGTLHHPGSFLGPIADFGLQGTFLTQMALQIFADVTALCDAGLDPGQVSLNVPEVALATYTGRQELHQIIADNPRITKHLTLEITEDVFIARAADTIQASICDFRAMGLRISLDDFGTGFASFHHLMALDFDELKIDRSFVARLGQDPSAEVLVSGFLNMASGLGVGVVAEGVETEDQRRDLINMGCISAQGYLFGKAQPLGDAIKHLIAQKAA